MRVGLRRPSTKRSADKPITLRDFEGGPAIDRDDVHAALAALVGDVSLAAEGKRAPEIPPAKKQPAISDAIDDLEDRVAALEEALSLKAATD